MEVYTDQPGVQFYTSNGLDLKDAKNGHHYKKHSALALETQNYPDAINQVSGVEELKERMLGLPGFNLCSNDVLSVTSDRRKLVDQAKRSWKNEGITT